MKIKLFASLFIFWLLKIKCGAQASNTEILLLEKLDSVRKSSSISKYFAELYFKTTVEAVNFFLNNNKKKKNFITRLETRFTSFFFRSVDAYNRWTDIPEEWNAYFAKSGYHQFNLNYLASMLISTEISGRRLQLNSACRNSWRTWRVI